MKYNIICILLLLHQMYLTQVNLNLVFVDIIYWMFVSIWFQVLLTNLKVLQHMYCLFFDLRLLITTLVSANLPYTGADPGFQVRGAHWNNCAERREARTFLGYFVWKITILRQKIIFYPILVGAETRRVRSPWSAPDILTDINWMINER
jgi:hypothetical protein